MDEVLMDERPDILLIEDSPSQALRAQLVLQRAGYTVQIAPDGAAGWHQAHALAPRLILLDVDLPTFDGFQLLARLKRDRATANIPVVMLTHREHIDHVERAISLGADDYLFKDDGERQLCAVVAQLLSATEPQNT
jgi:DNA-binding response OmpR family regulator